VMKTMNHRDVKAGRDHALFAAVVPAGPRVGDRQRPAVSGMPDDAPSENPGNWRDRNPGYASHGGLTSERHSQKRRAASIAGPLAQLPWNFAKDQFGPQGADFIALMGALMVRTAKDQIRPYLIDPAGFPAHFPSSQKTSSGFPHTRTGEPAMQLEFHQLDRRWEHLRVREPHRQRQLLRRWLRAASRRPSLS